MAAHDKVEYNVMPWRKPLRKSPEGAKEGGASLLDSLLIFSPDEEAEFQLMMQYRRLRLERIIVWFAMAAAFIFFPVDIIGFPRNHGPVVFIRIFCLIGLSIAFLSLNPVRRPARWRFNTTLYLVLVNACICAMPIFGDVREPGVVITGFGTIVAIGAVLVGAGDRWCVLILSSATVILLIVSYFLSPFAATGHVGILVFQIVMVVDISVLGYVAIHNREAAMRHDFATTRREKTLRAHTEETLAVEQLALREQRNFVAMVSHEFRTPISIIRTASNTVKKLVSRVADANLADNLAAIQRIERAAQRLVSLVDAVLMEDRLDMAPGSLRRETISLPDLTNEVAGDMRLLATRRTWRLRLARKWRLRRAEEITVDGDRLLLYTALRNVFDTATKYTADGDVIEIVVGANDEAAVITMHSQSMVIPAVDLQKIFDRQFRTSGAESRSGNGFGLYVAKRVIDLHHGEVVLESEEGKGSRLTIQLPLASPPP